MCTLQRELLLLTLIAFPKKKMKKDLLLFLLKIVHCTSVQASDSGIMYKSKNALAELRRRPFFAQVFVLCPLLGNLDAKEFGTDITSALILTPSFITPIFWCLTSTSHKVIHTEQRSNITKVLPAAYLI